MQSGNISSPLLRTQKGDFRSIWKLIKLLANNKSMCQPESLAVAPGRVISAAVEMADYFNLHFMIIANKITQTLPTIDDISFDNYVSLFKLN